MASQRDERTLEILLKTYDEMQRYHILLRLIKADLEKMINNLTAVNGKY